MCLITTFIGISLGCSGIKNRMVKWEKGTTYSRDATTINNVWGCSVQMCTGDVYWFPKIEVPLVIIHVHSEFVTKTIQLLGTPTGKPHIQNLTLIVPR